MTNLNSVLALLTLGLFLFLVYRIIRTIIGA
jgi:hypothetical protein